MTQLINNIDPASPFDAIRHTRPDGSEYWSARGLQRLMGYVRWKDNRPMQQQPDSSLPVGRRITQGDARTLDRTPHRKGFKPETIRVLKVAASALTASFFTTVGVELAFAGDEWGGLALALAGVTAGTVGGFFIGDVQEEPLPEVDAGLPEVDDSWLEAFYDREMTR